MSKKQKATDPSRFEGNGISYRGKLIGIEDVAEARGDKMCQETIQKLKGAVKTSGQHKQRVFINVTLEGLKIIDGVAQSVLHTHPVHQISFISRDVTDSRAFGYVFASGDGSHKFFGIKTASSAENVVLALRDLFHTVYEMKKQEMEEAKAKAAGGGTETQSEGKDTETSTDATEVKSEENVEQVAKNNAPVDPQEQQEVVANLLDLEDQVDTILKGIEQIKKLDFEEQASEGAPVQDAFTATSPVSTAAPSTAAPTDPWGMPASADTTPAPTKSSSSALSDLEQLSSPPPSSNPFSGMQPFPGGPASSSDAFFGMGQPAMAQPGMTQPSVGFPGVAQPAMAQPVVAQPAMTQPSMPFGPQGMMGVNMGLPVTKDPFGDPFNTSQAQQQMQAPQMMAPSGGQFGMQPAFSSPFPAATMGGPAPAQPFLGSTTAPGAGGMQPAFGRASPSFAPFGTAATPATSMGMQMGPLGGAVADPFQPSADSFLQPSRSESQEGKARPVSPGHANLFDDLVDIKKSAGAESATKSPKEIFQQLTQPPKKSLNDMKGGAGAEAPQASVVFDHDPFTEDPFGSIDTMLNTIASSDTDPFGTPHLPPPSSSPPPLPPPSLPHPPPAPPDPSPAQPNLTLSTPSSKESSPETRFDVPDEPPPPLPPHLMLGAAAPSPPPRPPPIPNRPMPKTQKNSPAKSVSRSFSTPPPLPTTPRPSSSIASSSPASELSASDTAPSAMDGFKEAQVSRDTSAQSSPRVHHPNAPASPSHSWGSSGSLSHSSSQKSLEKAAITADNDDPFGVPLRSKKSFSSADGASKRSSRSSGKLSVKSDSKVSVAVDPFGVPLKDRTNSSEGTVSKTDVATVDNPFSFPAFSDSVSVASAPSPWEAFGDHPGNGVTDTKKPVAMVAPNGQRSNSSPFGDSFFSTPINGKPSDAQS